MDDSARPGRRRLAAAALAALGLGTAGCTVGALASWGLWFDPPAVLGTSVRCSGDVPEIPRHRPVRMLVWNIQYAASRNHHFFYDGGSAVSTTEADVEATLDGIAEVIRRVDPDLVLWQEVDRGSRRTHGIDELEALLQRVPYPCVTDTPYHKAPYVPYPAHEHLGKVDMRLAVMSRYRIDKATRFDLPRLNEPWLRQQFNLKRAMLAAELPVEGGGRFVAFDAHLSAFSRGDGTVARQLAAMAERIDAAEQEGAAWVLGADLNCLPPGDDPSRLGDQVSLYEAESPLIPWFDRYASAVPLLEHQRDPGPFRTYMPWGSQAADRAIDHVFHAPTVEMRRFSVLQDVTTLSDHHPMLFEFVLR